MKYATQNCMIEWHYNSGKIYKDPFNEVELYVIFTGPDGKERVVPAFWAGDNTWRVRYSSPSVGRHNYRTVCSDKTNSDLHNQKGVLEITPYNGNNLLLKHGPLRISADKRHLEHFDGTLFLWLGDTWWMGLCKRLIWPEEFKELTTDRVSKGFTVIQIIAGLYPDMPPFDERGANEAGFPWGKDYGCINPSYFDMADLRIGWLVQSGLVPCIVGCWGYFLDFAEIDVIKKHWRNLVARYGAYPVIWCVAGEALMPYYLKDFGNTENEQKKRREEYIANTRAGWTEVTRYIKSIDPYHHPVTIHPTNYGHDMIDDTSLIDIDMLQTGHSSHNSLANTLDMLKISITHTPKMPVLVGEVCYEGIMEASRQEIQRFLFWTCILSGAAGHTYGANGIWQVNTNEKPFGPSPHGSSWGDISWQEAYKLPGSYQLGIGKKLLERYPWWQFEPHQEWVEPCGGEENWLRPYAAGIPGKVRIIYTAYTYIYEENLSSVKMIEREIKYQAFYFDPKNGREYNLGIVVPDKDGNWQPPKPPIFQDWVLVLENIGKERVRTRKRGN